MSDWMRKGITWIVVVTLAWVMVPLSVSAEDSNGNIELLRSDSQEIDGKIKVTGDVRVEESETVTFLAIGYNRAGDIVEIAYENTFIMGGRTKVFELEMEQADLIDRVDIQTLGPIDAPYEVIAEAVIPEDDELRIEAAIKNGRNSQTLSVIAAGYNKQGKLVEIRGKTNFVMDKRITVFKIDLEAIHEIEDVKITVLTDDATYLVDYATYVKDGRIVFTSVVKNGAESQSLMARITPYNGKGQPLSVITDTSFTMDHRLYNLKKTIRDASASHVQVTFYDETGKNEIGKRGTLVTIDGETLATEQPPVNLSGHVVVPMRAIFEALGAELEWEPQTKTVTATKGSKEIVLQIDSSTAYIDGEELELSANPQLINNHTMVPVRFVSEALDADVFWDQNAQTVLIIR